MILSMQHSTDIETTHQGKLFRVEVLRQRTEAGRVITREIVRHPGAVLIVPVLNSETLLLIRNERIAVGEQLLELPAGKLEPGEDPQQAAARELEEETGYRAAQMTKLGEFYTSPGFADELMRVYLAEDLEHVGQRLEPGEEISVEPVSRNAAIEMAAHGRLRDGKTIAGLLMWYVRTTCALKAC
jgi:ADP-ribose pyrophosphatase